MENSIVWGKKTPWEMAQLYINLHQVLYSEFAPEHFWNVYFLILVMEYSVAIRN